MEEIYKDWHSKKAPLFERIKFMFFINFEHYIGMISEMADNYTTINCYMSAAGLMKDCG